MGGLPQASTSVANLFPSNRRGISQGTPAAVPCNTTKLEQLVSYVFRASLAPHIGFEPHTAMGGLPEASTSE